jgi:NAD(P)-dependent dehydrogenase (short-subunit alcohol dehydrogenase family)
MSGTGDEPTTPEEVKTPPWADGRWLLAEPPEDRNIVRSDDLEGKVAVVTGAANGIGAGVARRLAAGGARVVVADVDDDGGRALAKEIDGLFVHCDVRRPEDTEAAIALAERTWGGLDLIHLNAGVTSGTSVDGFDIERYRRITGINLDGVVYGAMAAVPALRRRGGGTIIATASIAGLMPIPGEPFYAATKHAIIGFCRSLGLQLHGEGIVVRAICPSFTDTAIIAFGRDRLIEFGVPLLSVDDVVEGFVAALDDDRPGTCFYIVDGRPPGPFPFRRSLDDDGPPSPGDDAGATGNGE